MEINYILIAIAVIVQFVLGAVWYSPLMFGKFWMKVMGGDHQCTKEEMQKMQKEMKPFYILQIILTIIFTFVLSMFIYYLQISNVGFHAYGVAGWIWLGFILPTQISGVIWGNTKREFWLKQILIMFTYQLVGIMLAAFILSI